MGTTVLLNLVGGIALLLWGLHMVQSGILRAFGADLRRVLGIALRNRFAALLAGIGATALLQSSTATALMTATFLGDGIVGLVPALAIMLGANIGTTLTVQVFSFDVSAAAPVLLGIGVIVFKNSVRTKIRDLGRVAIGLGLMLLSLHILLDTLAPAESAPNVRALLAAMTGMPILNLIFGAVAAWAAHSSVAVVLLVISLTYSNFITPVAAFALVLGANLGSAINPLLESGLGNPIARRLPLGNLINRAFGCALVLPFLQPAVEFLSRLRYQYGAAGRPIFHTLFNLALAAHLHHPAACLRQAAAMAVAAAGRSFRSVGAGISRCCSDRDPVDSAHLRGERNTAHGGSGRDDAARDHDCPDDRRSPAGVYNRAHGQCGRQAP